MLYRLSYVGSATWLSCLYVVRCKSSRNTDTYETTLQQYLLTLRLVLVVVSMNDNWIFILSENIFCVLPLPPNMSNLIQNFLPQHHVFLHKKVDLFCERLTSCISRLLCTDRVAPCSPTQFLSLPPANKVWGKVMFLHLFVHRGRFFCMMSLPVWLPGPMFLETPPPYWNAFLFSCSFRKMSGFSR